MELKNIVDVNRKDSRAVISEKSSQGSSNNFTSIDNRYDTTVQAISVR